MSIQLKEKQQIGFTQFSLIKLTKQFTLQVLMVVFINGNKYADRSCF